MDNHMANNNIPLPSPGSAGGIQPTHWRTEVVPTKEDIEKEQYANLPDKLINTLNKDKKPFTYTPHGVSGDSSPQEQLQENQAVMEQQSEVPLSQEVSQQQQSHSESQPTENETQRKSELSIDSLMYKQLEGLTSKPKQEEVRTGAESNGEIVQNGEVGTHESETERYVNSIVQEVIEETFNKQQQDNREESQRIETNNSQSVETHQQNDVLTNTATEQTDGNDAYRSADNNIDETPTQQPLITSDSNHITIINVVPINQSQTTIQEVESYESCPPRPPSPPYIPQPPVQPQQYAKPQPQQIIQEPQLIEEPFPLQDPQPLRMYSLQESQYQPQAQHPPPPPPPLPKYYTPPQQTQSNANSSQYQYKPQVYSPPQQQQQNQVYTQVKLPQQNQVYSQVKPPQQTNNYATNGNNAYGRNISNRYDNSGSSIRQSDPWQSDLLKHVLDGGLQAEIEKFEQISLEANPRNQYHTTSVENVSPNSYQSYNSTYKATPSHVSAYETMTESYRTENIEPIDAPPIETKPILFKDARNVFKQIQDNHAKSEAKSFEMFRKNRSPQPQTRPPPASPSVWSANDEFWSSHRSTPTVSSYVENSSRIQSPTPPPSTPLSSFSSFSNQCQSSDYSSNTSDYTQQSDPLYRGGHIPSKSFQYIKQKTGITDAEAPNYNPRPKPFYLCTQQSESESQTQTYRIRQVSAPQQQSQPQPPQPPQKPQIQTRQQPQFQRETFGEHIAPPKIDYLEKTMAPTSKPSSYLDNSKMYSQTTYSKNWLESEVDYSPMTSNRSSGCNSPTPSEQIRRKKLPPSERQCDPTPPKYQGGDIPSRSFRILQLMTGEDIENQYQRDQSQTSYTTKSTISRQTSNQSYKSTPHLDYVQPQQQRSSFVTEDNGTDF